MGTGGIHAGVSGTASFAVLSLAAALLDRLAADFFPAAVAPPTPAVAAAAASAAAGAGTGVLLTCTIARCSCLLYAANAALSSWRLWVVQGMLHSTAAGGAAAAGGTAGPEGSTCRALSTTEPFLPLAVPEPLTDEPLPVLPAAPPALDPAAAAAVAGVAPAARTPPWPFGVSCACPGKPQADSTSCCLSESWCTNRSRWWGCSWDSSGSSSCGCGTCSRLWVVPSRASSCCTCEQGLWDGGVGCAGRTNGRGCGFGLCVECMFRMCCEPSTVTSATECAESGGCTNGSPVPWQQSCAYTGFLPISFPCLAAM
jgi:hypothetical protein